MSNIDLTVVSHKMYISRSSTRRLEKKKDGRRKEEGDKGRSVEADLSRIH